MNSYRKEQREAFTLVEVLICIGIIVLLMGLLIPQIPIIKDQVNRTRCCEHLRQLTLAATHYSTDKNVFPDKEKWLRQDPAQGVKVGQLYSYLGDDKVYYCPSDPEIASRFKPTAQSRLSSYKYNDWLNQRNPNTVSDASMVVVFMEGATTDKEGTSASFTPANPPALNDWHTGGAHIVYADAHTEYLSCEAFAANKAKLFRETKN